MLALPFGSPGSSATTIKILNFAQEIQEIFINDTAFVILGKRGKVRYYALDGLRRTLEVGHDLASATLTADGTVICALADADAIAIRYV